MIIVKMLEELFKVSKAPGNIETSKQKKKRIMLMMLFATLVAAFMMVTNRAIILSTQYQELKERYDVLVEQQSKNHQPDSSDRGNGLDPKGFWELSRDYSHAVNHLRMN